MQIILKRSRLRAEPRLLQWTKKARSVKTGDFTPSVSRREDSEIAGRTKPHPNWLGSVKTPCVCQIKTLKA